jgi:tellurite resistance protein TehA-like permease
VLIGPSVAVVSLQLSTPPVALHRFFNVSCLLFLSKWLLKHFFHRKEFRRKGRPFYASSFSPAILILLLVDITNEGM